MKLTSFIIPVTLCALQVLGLPSALSRTGHWRRTVNPDSSNSIVDQSLPKFHARSQNIDELCNAGVKQTSGYLDTADDKHFFYWFFEAQNQTKGKDTPLLVWLNGGPGCSSMLGLLTAVGPCLVADNSNSTTPNPYGWNQNANMLFVDQPIGTGFSYGTPVGNSTAAANDFVELLQLFYKSFPQYHTSELHVFGESYAGHYVPAIGSAIVDHNAHSSLELQIPLKSIGIGNGEINPQNQFKYLSKMACNSTYEPIFSQETCQQMDVDYGFCSRMIDNCFSTGDENKCGIAINYCFTVLEGMFGYDNPDVNPYDVRTKCEVEPLCYANAGYVGELLNQTWVQEALNAQVGNYESCSRNVQDMFFSEFDMIRSYDGELAKTLDAGVLALVYNGDADWLCNWYGVKSTLEEMKWSGQSEFNCASDASWLVGSEKAGEVKASNGLTFLRVYNSGHMVPMDQPVNALSMINRWLAHGAI
ncbi:hypothetical protein GGF49_004945 [Coemansia sp. RSA 1853]|nr:hypothetical protein LPJ76_002232 [Coemansia sp. RSA 638]KAJ2539810.1 hypothetical protein GGF49_004945 [Coemansia sp. RSA 1853]